MKTENDYIINEENDTGEEHAKLVMSRLYQNPDMSLNEIIKQTVPEEFIDILTFAVKEMIWDTLR